MVRASACHAEGRGFKSRHSRHSSTALYFELLLFFEGTLCRMSKNPPFIHLRAHSAYSLSEGAIHPKKLAALCEKYQMPAVAMTDSSNLFGVLEFSKACTDIGVQPIFGGIFHLRIAATINHAEHFPKILLLAKNDDGLAALYSIMHFAHKNTAHSSTPHIRWEELFSHSKNLILLSGGVEGPIGHFLQTGREGEAEDCLLRLRDNFSDRLYIELMRHNLPIEKQLEPKFLKLAKSYNIPIVATNDVYFAIADMFDAHDALLCIASGRYVSEDDRRRVTPEHYFKSMEEMEKLFSDLPEAITNSAIIAKRCAALVKSRAPMLPSFPCEHGSNEAEELEALSRIGLEQHFINSVFPRASTAEEQQELRKKYEERLEFELSVIKRMEYSGYFLIVSDFMRWSKRKNIPVGPGRGSGAGSLVAWALEITDLDPIRFGLLFERFLNPERISMPDFDIDFCQERRDEVMHYVQKKYGADRVAHIITFGKLQARAVLRDVGRVLQMPYGKIDKLTKMIPFNPLEPVTLAKAIDMDKGLQQLRDEDQEIARLINLSLKLEGLYRHASTHAAGVVIADRDLKSLVPVYCDQRSPMLVTGYSMKYAEMAGLVKFDFLGLKTLTVIAKATEFIHAHTGNFNIRNIELDDLKTYAMLSAGESVGVFQLESAGMRDTLRKLKPDTIEDIIALISLYRPGPMDNIPTYIARKHGLETPDYLHPMLTEILTETFGVMIYQEQVMQIAQVMAGYTLGGADLLRRAMGKKIAAEMDAQRNLFVEGAIKNGVDPRQASNIFDLVAKFAGYGFNKSHAAAYAIISYQTAFLKANYPVEFIAASMNLDIDDTDKINIFVQETKLLQIPLLAPDINLSYSLFKPEETAEKKAIRYGLGSLKNISVSAIEMMISDRIKNGLYNDVFDFMERVGTNFNRRQIEQLIRSGAFDSLHKNRRESIENVEIFMSYAQMRRAERQSSQGSLFAEDKAFADERPKLKTTNDWQVLERLQNEYEAFGFYLEDHPLESFKHILGKSGVKPFLSATAALPTGVSRLKLAGIVTGKSIRSSARGRYAVLNLSDKSSVFEVSIYNEDLLQTHRELLETGTMLLMEIDARKDEGGVRLIIDKFQSLEEAVIHLKSQIKITLKDSEKGSLSLQQMLAKTPKGRTEILLSLTTKDEKTRAEIKLPGSYQIMPSQLESISALDGIDTVEEVS